MRRVEDYLLGNCLSVACRMEKKAKDTEDIFLASKQIEVKKMLRTILKKAPTTLAGKNTELPLDILTKIQLGITPPLSVQRGFLLEHCNEQLQQRGITEAKLLAMDGRICAQLLKQLVYEHYLSFPFRVFTFDMEFTGPPVFASTGPTEDITELGLYSPARDEIFSCLVRPVCGRKQSPEVDQLTQITDKMLQDEGLPFVQAWSQFLKFVNTPEPNEKNGSEECILLLSHGGKLADVSLIKWTLEKFKLELPSSFIFGDTIHIIRDAHRCRPVTVDKHPPSWKLVDLAQWLRIPLTLPVHRAGNDAKITWDVLYHTLLRYGDEELSPREQLVSHFFDERAKQRMKSIRAKQVLYKGGGGCYSETDMTSLDRGHGHSETNLSSSGLELDFDDIFGDSDGPKCRFPITESLSEDNVRSDRSSTSKPFESQPLQEKRPLRSRASELTKPKTVWSESRDVSSKPNNKMSERTSELRKQKHTEEVTKLHNSSEKSFLV